MTRSILLVLALTAILSGADEGFVVVIKKGDSRTVTKGQLKNLLLGQTASWTGGGKIRLALGPPGEPSRVAALKRLADMTEADYSKNVIHLNFVGHSDAAPMSMPSTSIVRMLAHTTDGTIGVIPPGEVNDTVTVLPLK